jgi:hypothetical protein
MKMGGGSTPGGARASSAVAFSAEPGSLVCTLTEPAVSTVMWSSPRVPATSSGVGWGGTVMWSSAVAWLVAFEVGGAAPWARAISASAWSEREGGSSARRSGTFWDECMASTNGRTAPVEGRSLLVA